MTIGRGMPADASKKLLEKLSSSQCALLRSLTDVETLDARWLERAVTSIVRDRFALATGFIKAARVLAKSKDPLVRRGAAPYPVHTMELTTPRGRQSL